MGIQKFFNKDRTVKNVNQYWFKNFEDRENWYKKIYKKYYTPEERQAFRDKNLKVESTEEKTSSVGSRKLIQDVIRNNGFEHSLNALNSTRPQEDFKSSSVPLTSTINGCNSLGAVM
jgi:hypothetical protein